MKILKCSKKVDPKQLTPLETLFVKEYLIDFNACAAIRRCGKKFNSQAMERKTAMRMVAKDLVQAAIYKEFAIRTAKVEVNVEFVLKELMQIANCDVLDAFDEKGVLKSIHSIPVHVRKSISSFSSEETTIKGFKVGQLKKVTFWDKKGSLELLGKYLAMFVERQRVEGADGQPMPAVHVNVITHKAPVQAEASRVSEVSLQENAASS